MKEPNLIYPGQVIQIPDVDISYIYTVKSNDSIQDIAQKFLGSSDKFHNILKINQDVINLGDELNVGQKLKIKFTDGTCCYTVRKGDWLSKICGQLYGDPLIYPWIFQKNRHSIKNPNLIYPGQKIILSPN